jgi:hypothetical protein
MLPLLPPGPILEPAPGAGALVDAMRAAEREVAIGDRDFLADVPPAGPFAAITTNPPFNRHSAFIQRGLELIDRGVTQSLVLLFRHDHLQGESRTPPKCRLDALERANLILLCAWRPRWIVGTRKAPRWTFSWVLWRAGADGPPVYRIFRKESL